MWGLSVSNLFLSFWGEESSKECSLAGTECLKKKKKWQEFNIVCQHLSGAFLERHGGVARHEDAGSRALHRSSGRHPVSNLRNGINQEDGGQPSHPTRQPSPPSLFPEGTAKLGLISETLAPHLEQMPTA